MTTLAAIIAHGRLEQWLADYGYLAVFLMIGSRASVFRSPARRC